MEGGSVFFFSEKVGAREREQRVRIPSLYCTPPSPLGYPLAPPPQDPPPFPKRFTISDLLVKRTAEISVLYGYLPPAYN